MPRKTSLDERFIVEGAEPGTLEYSRTIAYRYVGRMRSKKNRAYARAYLAHIEGKRRNPEALDYGVNPKTAYKIRMNILPYEDKLTGKR